MRWEEFEAACPEIASKASERFLGDGLVLIGTLRRDGSPRISPNEPAFGADRLFISMMWRSKKALDVLRDPQVVVHSIPGDRENGGDDVKGPGRTELPSLLARRGGGRRSSGSCATRSPSPGIREAASGRLTSPG